MLEEDRLRLEDLAERIAEIRLWTTDLDETSFLADAKTTAAATMNLMVIGETARRLTHAIQQQAPVER